jgi:hypothetical protein
MRQGSRRDHRVPKAFGSFCSGETLEETYHAATQNRGPAVTLTDDATATCSMLVLGRARPGLVCIGARSRHPTLLLQRRVFSGHKRAYGEMHDRRRCGFRRGIRWELEVCTR